MATPVIFAAGISGLPLSGSDYNNNWALIESSFLDQGAFVMSGLVPSLTAGLGVAVSAGTALIGAHMAVASFTIAPLVPNTLNYLYLLQNGQGSANTTGIAPANSVQLGTATTGPAAVTSISTARSSGRQLWNQPLNLVLGQPGAPRSLNLGAWNASAGDGFECYGVLAGAALPPGGARPSFAPVATKTGAYTLVAADFTIRADASGGPFTLTLPSAVTMGAGYPFLIKKVDSSANGVTVATTGGQTIDGAATFVLVNPNSAIFVYSTGTNWEIS